MKFETFQKLVADHLEWFQGQLPESVESFAQYELQVGCSFPQSLKWLLVTHGYGQATGIDDLEESIRLTLECRESLNLPNRYIILNDHGDGGVIVLDTQSVMPDGEMLIHDVEASELHGLDIRDIEPDIVYESFGEYVAAILVASRGHEDL